MSWQNARRRQRDPEFHRDTNGLVLALEVNLAGRRISFSFNAEGRTKPGRSSEQEAESRKGPRHKANRRQGRRQAAQRVEEASSREGSPVEGVGRRGPGGWRLGRLWAKPGRHLAPSRTQAAEVEGRTGTAPDREQENQPNRTRHGRHRAGRTETRRAALARTSRAGLAKVRSGLGTAVHAPVQAWQKLRNKPGRAEGKHQGTGFWREVRQLVPSRWAMAMALGVSGTGINLAGAWLGGNSAIAGNLAGIGWAMTLQGVLVAAAEVWTSRRFKGKTEPSKSAEQARLDSLELQGREIDERLAKLEGRGDDGREGPSVDPQQPQPGPTPSGQSQELPPEPEGNTPATPPQPGSAAEQQSPDVANQQRPEQEVGGQAPLGNPPTPAQEPDVQPTPGAGQPQPVQGQQLDPGQAMAEAAQWRDTARRGAADATQRRDEAQQRVDYLASIQPRAIHEAQQQENARQYYQQGATAWQQEAQARRQEAQQGAPWAADQAQRAEYNAGQWEQAARQAEQHRYVHAGNAGDIGQELAAARQQVADADAERQQYEQVAAQAEAVRTSIEQQAGRGQGQQPEAPQHEPGQVQAQEQGQEQQPVWPQHDPDQVQGPGQQGMPGQPQPTPAGREQNAESTGPVPTGGQPQGQQPQPGAFVAPQPAARGGESAATERPADSAQRPAGGRPEKYANPLRDGRHSVGYSQTGRRAPNGDRRTSDDRDKNPRPGAGGSGHTQGQP